MAHQCTKDQWRPSSEKEMFDLAKKLACIANAESNSETLTLGKLSEECCVLLEDVATAVTCHWKYDWKVGGYVYPIELQNVITD